jgi:hypothetical protein
MAVNINIAKKWFSDNKSLFDSDDEIHTIPTALLFKRARDLGNTIKISPGAFEDLSITDKRTFIYALKNTGIVPDAPNEEEEEVEEEEEEEDYEDEGGDGVSLASALNYMLSSSEKDPEMTRFLQCISKSYKDQDFSIVRRLCTTLAKKTAHVNGDQPFGVVRDIDYSQYVQWSDQQTQTKVVVGPLFLWNVCERLGLACTAHASRANGKEYLIYDRVGAKLHMYDRFMVHSNYATGVEASEEEVNNFLEGLKFKGKSILYKYISPGAYKAAMAFLSTFKVQVNKDASATCQLILLKGDKVRLPDLERNTRALVDAIKTAFADGKIKGDSFITVFENMARWAHQHKTKNHLEDALGELDQADVNIDQDIKAYMESFAVAAKQNGVVKGNTLTQLFGAKGKPTDACLYLEACRKLRNATPANTFVNHGVGSVRGSNLPEWVDTYHKGEQMIEWAMNNGPEITKETLFSVYGVAYGHMIPLFKALVNEESPKEALRFYDITKAKDSTETFMVGDVFSHNRKGSWVFDDTDAHRLPKNSGYEEINLTGDHLKIMRFMEAGAPVIVSKVDLASFCSATHMAQWEQMLSPSAYVYRLVKMGRLHNSECYLAMAKSENPTPFKNFRGDLWGVSLCVEIANIIIMQWQNAGLRAGFRLPVNEIDGGRVTLGCVWRALIRALPVSWPWYLRKVTDVSFKTVAVMEEERDVAELGLDDQAFEDEEAWGATGMPEVEVDPMYQKKKIPAVQYVNGLVYRPVKGEVLGYGASDKIQQGVNDGSIQAVMWSVPHNAWCPYDIPEKEKVKKDAEKPKRSLRKK